MQAVLETAHRYHRAVNRFRAAGERNDQVEVEIARTEMGDAARALDGLVEPPEARRLRTLSTEEIEDMARKQGVKVNFSPEKKQEIRERVASGESCAAVARDLDVARPTIARIVKQGEGGAVVEEKDFVDKFIEKQAKKNPEFPKLVEEAQKRRRGEGRKDDAEKLRYDLVPPIAEEHVVAVLTFGAKKYAPDNWRKVPEPQARYHAAARRHIAAWAKGEKLDPETGRPHLAHAICCLMFLAELDS